MPELSVLEKPVYTETEQRILEAALHVFAEVGKGGARMQDIANRAGINKALLHYYFRSKDRLYEHTIGFMFRSLMDSLAGGIRGEASFEEVLKALITGYIGFIERHQVLTRLMMNELLGGATVITRLLPALTLHEDAPLQVFFRRFREAQLNGEIRMLSPQQTLVSIISCCVFFFLAFPLLQAISLNEAPDPESFIEARKQHVFDLIYHGLKAEPAR